MNEETGKVCERRPVASKRMKSVYSVMFVTMVGCGSEGSTGGGGQGGASGGHGGQGGQGSASASTMLIALPSTSDDTRAVRAAALGENAVAVLVKTVGSLGDLPPYELSLVAVSDTGAILWNKQVDAAFGGATIDHVLAPTKAGDVLIGVNARVQAISGAGNVTWSRDIRGYVEAVAETPDGDVTACVRISPEDQTALGMVPIGANLSVLLRKLKSSTSYDILELDGCGPMVVDELGVTWVGSKPPTRVDTNGTTAALALPGLSETASSRPGGGAYLQWVPTLDPTGPVDPAVAGLKLGSYWLELGPSGDVQAKTFVSPAGEFHPLVMSAQSGLGRLTAGVQTSQAKSPHDQIFFNSDTVQSAAFLRGHAGVGDVVATGTAFWVVGHFNGHMKLFDTEIRSGVPDFVPFVFRASNAAALQPIGEGVAACTQLSDPCYACMKACRSTFCPATMICDSGTTLTACMCRAPEAGAACGDYAKAQGMEYPDEFAACAFQTCQKECSEP